MKNIATYRFFITIWVATLMLTICANSVSYISVGKSAKKLAITITEEDNDDEPGDANDSEKEGDGPGKEKSSESFALLSTTSFDLLSCIELNKEKAPVPVQSVRSVILTVFAPPPELG